MATISNESLEAFRSNIVSAGSDICWAWNGELDEHGLPIHEGVLADRVSFQLANGVSLTPFEFVMHSCARHDCVNPFHLFKVDLN